MAQEAATKALRLSYLLSFGLALLLAGAFFAFTTLRGGYSPLARYGGAGWVFLLSLIVALPTITPVLKKRFKGREGPA